MAYHARPDRSSGSGRPGAPGGAHGGVTIQSKVTETDDRPGPVERERRG